MEPSGDMKNKESRVGNMAVRDEIIKTLEENRGTYLSGEQLAKKLSVSRAAVWKAIRKLQEDGFAIEGVNNKGYKLAEDTDVLSVQGTANRRTDSEDWDARLCRRQIQESISVSC